MAAIFCLFSVTLCNLASNEVTDNSINLSNENSRQDLAMSLNAQLITVPRVYISPCPESFRYTFNGKEWFGLIVVKKPAPRGTTSKLKVLLSVGFHFSSRYVGEINLAKDKQSAVNDIASGLPLLYRVRFPLQNPLPKVTAIYYNDQLICTGPNAIGQFVTTITLDHTFVTGLTQPPQRPYVAVTKQPEEVTLPIWTPPQTTRRPYVQMTKETSTVSNLNSGDSDNDSVCGVPEYRAPTSTGLVIGGQSAVRGQFPWLAAYFSDGVFLCGGSLISTKLILTAAHCIHYKKDPIIRKADEATFYLGKQDLESLSERNYISSGVTKFVIHPSWDSNSDSYDADIAIAVLTRTVRFNKFVKPICLWTSTSDTTDLVGKTGTVAGWGKTEFDAISTASSKWAEFPVVDLLTCIRSHDVFSKLTSDRTFCAGSRVEGKGPCTGDSGGGFVTKSGGKWFLRGIVSSSVFDHAAQSCDTKNYAVFTDTSKFTTWVQDYVEAYG